MANSTLTLQSVVNFASTHVELLPLTGVGGYSNEPALSLCNDTLQKLLSRPLDWKFNRAEMNMFVTAPNRQDYLFAGAVAFTLAGSCRGVGIELTTNSGIVVSSNVVTVTCLQPHGFNTGETVYIQGAADNQFNASLVQDGNTSSFTGGFVITGTPTTTTFTFAKTTANTASGSAGITDYGWLAEGTMWNINNTSPVFPTRHIQAVRSIQPESIVSTPKKACIISDPGTGILKIRLSPVAGTVIWGVNLIYQKKAPLLSSLSSTWAPIPDEFGYVIRQKFLAVCYRFLNSARSEIEEQKAQAAILEALGEGDRENSDVGLYPEEGIMTSMDNYWIL